jgi:hypothetical protein
MPQKWKLVLRKACAKKKSTPSERRMSAAQVTEDKDGT